VSLFRRSRPEPPSLPLLLERGMPEAHVAVGNLAGIDPSDIHGHLLIVIDRGGQASLTGNACPELAVMILTGMAARLAQQAYAAHECEGGTEAEGADHD
jgi:hypothetical protein